MAKKRIDDKNSQQSENAKTDSENLSNDEEPNFSDSESYVDNVSDEGNIFLFNRVNPKFTCPYVLKRLFFQYVVFFSLLIFIYKF